MNTIPLVHATLHSPAIERPSAQLQTEQADDKLREVFTQFVGRTFYGQMLAAMRKTVDKPAYFHGGRAEEVFQGQLDQQLADELAEQTSEKLSGPMFDLFQLSRK